jgi:hypothetical protein
MQDRPVADLLVAAHRAEAGDRVEEGQAELAQAGAIPAPLASTDTFKKRIRKRRAKGSTTTFEAR